MGGRNHDGTDLVQGQHYYPPLVTTLQDEHHGVVLADAQRHQITGGLIGLLLQFGEGGADLLTLIVGPEDGESLRCLLSPRVHHVVGEIEVLRDDELQILVIILNRRELSLLQKTFYHNIYFWATDYRIQGLFCASVVLVVLSVANYYSTVKARNFTGLSPTASMPWGLVESK